MSFFSLAARPTIAVGDPKGKTINDGFLRRGVAVHGFLTISVLVFHALSLRLSDLVSVTSNTVTAFGAMGVYGLVGFLPPALVCYWRRPNTLPNRPHGILEAVDRRIFWVMAVSLLGVLLHWDAKWRLLNGETSTIFIRLRELWIHQPSTLPWWHRLESVLGHLLSSMAHAGLFYSACLWVAGGPRWRTAFAFFGFVVLAISYAMAIVSRGAMLMDLLVLVAAVAAVYTWGRTPLIPLLRRGLMVLGLFSAVSLFLVVFLFGQAIEREQRNHLTPTSEIKDYESGFFDEIPIRRLEQPDGLRRVVRRIAPRANTVMLYLNHATFNFAYVLGIKERGEGRLFSCFYQWIRLLRLCSAPKGPPSRVFGRGGVTLAGAAYHDFGWAGVVIAALAHGLLFTGALAWMRGTGWTAVTGTVVFLSSVLTTGLSGLFVAASLSPFPFVLFSIFTVGMVATFWPGASAERGSAGA